MPVSKTVIPLDDEETIRRFTDEIRRRSTTSLPSVQVQVENLEHTIVERNSHSHIEHPPTQTEPVTITPANGGPQPRNGFLAKPKSALDSVLLQSPPGSGVMAPPSTPENRPGLSNSEISRLIIDNIESLPATSTFTLGESRHAPNRSSSRGRQTYMQGLTANDRMSSPMPKGRKSSTDRNFRNQSFPRMSFQAADSPPITAPMTSPAPVSISPAESSTDVLRSTSSLSASTDTMAEISPLSVLEKSVSSSRWANPRAYPQVNQPATKPTSPRPAGVKTWNSFAAIANDINAKPEEAFLKCAVGSVLQGTADLAISDNEQVPSPVKGDMSDNETVASPVKEDMSGNEQLASPVKGDMPDKEQMAFPVKGDTAPTDPKDKWLPPHLRTPDYAFKDPRIVKPNRSYLSKMFSSGVVTKENKKPSTDDSVSKPVAEIRTAPAQAATSSDDPVPSEPIPMPSSIIFSPPAPIESNTVNREGQLYFSAWGKPEHRHKARMWLPIFFQMYRRLILCSRQSPKGYHQASQPHSFTCCFTCMGWRYRRNSHKDKFC